MPSDASGLGHPDRASDDYGEHSAAERDDQRPLVQPHERNLYDGQRVSFSPIAGPGISRPPGTPNIVIILTGDQGWGDLTCYNPDSKIVTPNLDRLASQGVRLLNDLFKQQPEIVAALRERLEKILLEDRSRALD